jgi:hypothetical protein
VFRYALRGAESEWALLNDEIEFVRAYLDVERARFGSRLTVDVRLDDDVRGARVPTMVVQTLVENAVKHGVAQVRGPARVRSTPGSRAITSSSRSPTTDRDSSSRRSARPVPRPVVMVWPTSVAASRGTSAPPPT